MTRKEVEKEIRKRIYAANADIANLEQTGYKSASFIYESLQKWRFDQRSFLTKGAKGRFRMPNTRMKKAELLNELIALKQWERSSTRNSKEIIKSNEERYQTFKKQFAEKYGRNIARKTYAKLVKAFIDSKDTLANYIASDVIVDLYENTTEKQFDALIEFMNSHGQKDNENYLKKKYGVDSEYGNIKTKSKWKSKK